MTKQPKRRLPFRHTSDSPRCRACYTTSSPNHPSQHHTIAGHLRTSPTISICTASIATSTLHHTKKHSTAKLSSPQPRNTCPPLPHILIRNPIRNQLKPIIHPRTLTTRTPPHTLLHKLRRTPLIPLQHKPLPKMPQRIRFKARQPAI